MRDARHAASSSSDRPDLPSLASNLIKCRLNCERDRKSLLPREIDLAASGAGISDVEHQIAEPIGYLAATALSNAYAT
jgi:hypothetical protein